MKLLPFRIAIPLLLVVLLAGCSKPKQALVCHVGGTMRPVMQELAKRYEAETGRKVEINSAGSGELLAHIESQKRGDLYVCHDPFLDILMHKKLGLDGWTVAEITPVIAVAKGNPKNIRDLKDLTRKDVEVFLTDYKLSSLGRMLSTIFGKAGIDLAQLNKDKVIHTHRSGSHAANVVVMNNADATMVWNAVVALRKKDLDAVPITPYLPVPYVDSVTSATKKSYILTPMRVTVATLKCATDGEGAAAFAKYLVSGKTAEVFREFGFTMGNDIIRKEYEGGKTLPGTKPRSAGAAK